MAVKDDRTRHRQSMSEKSDAARKNENKSAKRLPADAEVEQTEEEVTVRSTLPLVQLPLLTIISEAEISQDLPQPQTASKNATANTQAKVSRSQASARQTNASPDRQQTATQKKANRPARRGKVGRNQYTRDRDAAADARAEAVRALHSRDGEEHGSTDTFSQLLPNGSKPSRPKHMNPNRTSMNELRKRAAGILEYISRTQVEMAGEKTPSGTQTPSKSSSRTSLAQPASVNGMSKLSNEVPHSAASDEDKEPTKGEEAATVTSNAIELDSFKQMGTLQMMDVLTREIVHWQQQHGKWGQ